jgi:hypothetical protein
MFLYLNAFPHIVYVTDKILCRDAKGVLGKGSGGIYATILANTITVGEGGGGILT